SAMGASYAASRQCILAHQGKINAAISCSRGSMANVCGNGMVPRRYPETLQIAAFREINSMLTRSGVMAQASALLQVGKRVFGCIMKCGQQNS
ncbi:hypothetical protein PFISCL1PPCAC_3225, partial [Pristionchus fissidentatus]